MAWEATIKALTPFSGCSPAWAALPIILTVILSWADAFIIIQWKNKRKISIN